MKFPFLKALIINNINRNNKLKHLMQERMQRVEIGVFEELENTLIWIFY